MSVPTALRIASTAPRIHRAPLEGAVEIDDVKMREALRAEGFALIGRVGVIDRRLFHQPELQAHAFAILQVDGGKENGHQGFHFRKLAMRARPSVWLFSGWNCAPTLLPLATSAVTGPP